MATRMTAPLIGAEARLVRPRGYETAAEISFHRPNIDERQVQAVAQAVRAGLLAGNGPIGHAVEEQLCALLDVRHALLTNSGTAALEIALAALHVAGGEVILPSFGFSSLAAAVLRANARPVFADIEPAYLTLDPACVARVLSKETRAILHVDYGGWPGTLDAIRALALQHHVPLIEDAAHALGSRCRGRPLGSLGTVGCISFHETKIVTCGEGGVLLTNHQSVAEAAMHYREYGTNRSAFLLGSVDHYEWVGPGSSGLLAEPLAALLREQLRRLPDWVQQRQRIAARYLASFATVAASGQIQVLAISPGIEANWHVFPLLARTASAAGALLTALARQGIEARRHFYPLHLSRYAKHYGYASGDLPMTESVAGRLVRLPLYPGLTEAQQGRVIDAVLSFFFQQQFRLPS